MMGIKQPTSVKHIPHRTCVACRKVRPKRELVRLVCISSGSVEIDYTGKMVGRGAYLCPAKECWEVGLESGRLEHALRTSVTEDNRDQLISCAQKAW